MDRTIPLTVVILNFNGKEVVEKCVESFARQETLPQKVIFIDNHSDSFDSKKIENIFTPKFKHILEIRLLEENFGYAKGMNIGLEQIIKEDSTPWILTLNNDTELAPDFFKTLSSALSAQEPNVGMLSPKILAMHARDTLDATGIGLCMDGMSTARGQKEKDDRQYDYKTHILIPNGVAAIYKTDLLKDVGLLDEDFWAYCEDTDIGLRAWMAGWECRFLPESIVYHARSFSLGEFNLKKLYLVERNHYWVAIKSMPLPILLFNPFFSFYRYFLQVVAVFFKKGQGVPYGNKYSSVELGVATLKGIAHALIGSPKAFLKRLKSSHLRRRQFSESLWTLWKKRLRFEDLILK